MPDSGRYIRKISMLFMFALAGSAAPFTASRGFAQQTAKFEGRALYDGLKAFELQGKAAVSNLKLKRDLGEMTFTGDFYFASPINGRVTGAVFIGEGTFRAGAIESDFKTAVLRFTDDTPDIIGKGSVPSGTVPDRALDLAGELEPRLLKEAGANISARLAISLANNESPGLFLAQFDKGKMNRFTFLIDPQCRTLNYIFGIDAGEKIAVFSYDSYRYSNDLWLTTYTEKDFADKQVSYSTGYDVVDPKHYKMEIDIRKAMRELRIKMRIDFVSLTDNLRAIPMIMNENITAFDNRRLKNVMLVESARYNGRDIPCIQEEWESGLTLLLPKPMSKGEAFSIELSMAGDVIDDRRQYFDIYYPRGESNWYPRHGYLKRSTFDLIFRHRKAHQVAGVGSLVREEEWPDDDGDRLTEYRMGIPVPSVSFVAGTLERHSEKQKLESGEMDIHFYSLPNALNFQKINEKFVLGELGNALDYFTDNFGPYPYKDFQSTFCPSITDQTFANLVKLPVMNVAERYSLLYIGTATSRQWWGNLITMRSYRDQWLREGLVVYSGLLYVLESMQNKKEQREWLDILRYDLRKPPRTNTGVGEGKAAETGPIILGRMMRRLNSMNFENIIKYKGALVIRMLHYLFSDPSTGEDALFFEMLKDFTNQYAYKTASTDDFWLIANRHFTETPVAKKLGLKDLNWFFQQWLYEANLPGYHLEYSIEKGESGEVVLSGKIIQENAPKHWFMPLPVILKLPGDKQIRTIVWANGPETEIKVPPLPEEPDSVELDPDWWILSEKTETVRK